VSFDNDPGRDDTGLPPVDVVIPDDARELARDVLAYRRELRARRRRERLLRLLGPLGRLGLVRHGTVFPLIATCVALSLLAGTMLSVLTISPASAPTKVAASPTELPATTLQFDYGATVPSRTLTRSVLALIPRNCSCDTVLRSLAGQAARMKVGIYFVYDGEAANADAGRLEGQTSQDGADVAQTAFDPGGRLFGAYLPPYRLTALLVSSDATVYAVRAFPARFDLTPKMRDLAATH
jgi:hypothetical protein